jgi:hypothetical protein
MLMEKEKRKRKPKRLRSKVIRWLLYLGFTVLIVRFCCFPLIYFMRGPVPPRNFCTLEDDLVHELVANGEQWAEEFAARNRPLYMEVVSSTGEALHLLGDEYKRGFFVPVVWILRSIRGKVGYFYSSAEELPKLGPDDELTHLVGNVYCYTIAYP